MFPYRYLKFCFLGLLISMVSPTLAQKYCKWGDKGTDHLLKTNLLNLPLKTFNLEYERSFRPNISIGEDVSFTPKRDVPFKGSIIDKITNENAKKSVEETRFNQFSIIPQARFYFGDRDVFTRFYTSPYIKYSRYQTSSTLFYNSNVVNTANSTLIPIEVPISGNINTLSAGIAVGLQFQILKSLYLDWKIIGTHYGFLFGKGSGTSTQALSENLQEEIRKSLQKLDDLPFYSFPHTVTQDRVELKPKGANVGFTSAISVGYRF